MPETRNLEWEDLRILAAMGMHIRWRYGQSLSLRKQRSIRRWMEKHYADQTATLSDNARRYLAPENSDETVIDFLLACSEEMDRREKENLTAQALLLAPLGESVQFAFRYLREADFGIQIERLEEKRIALRVADAAGYCQILVLENAVLSAGCEEWTYINDTVQVLKEEGTYVLRVCYGNDDQEVLRFTDAHVQVTCYNCMEEQIFANDPWEHLRYLAYAILSKSEIPGDYCNAQEKALLPLLQEIQQIDIGNRTTQYPLLTELAREIGVGKLPFDKKMARDLLQRQAEPLWRAIYEKIRSSQQAYPSRVAQRCDAEQLENLRHSVQCFMHSQGFSGQYPDFHKIGEIRGMHLREAGGMPYLYTAEKNAKMFIHCVETLGGSDRPVLHFLCGAAMGDKTDEVQDVFGCWFQDKGRRLFWWVRDYDAAYMEDISRTEAETIQRAQIAVKRVQMQKLTKEEKSLYSYGAAVSDSLVLFWTWLIMGGGMFAAAMVVAFMLVIAVITALFGHWAQIPSLMGSIPWGWIFAFCWLGYGLPMGVLALAAKRR